MIVDLPAIDTRQSGELICRITFKTRWRSVMSFFFPAAPQFLSDL